MAVRAARVTSLEALKGLYSDCVVGRDWSNRRSCPAYLAVAAEARLELFRALWLVGLKQA